MSKFITFMGETRQNDKAQKATEDVACLLNKTNNTRTIKVNSNGDVCLFGDEEMLWEKILCLQRRWGLD